MVINRSLFLPPPLARLLGCFFFTGPKTRVGHSVGVSEVNHAE